MYVINEATAGFPTVHHPSQAEPAQFAPASPDSGRQFTTCSPGPRRYSDKVPGYQCFLTEGTVVAVCLSQDHLVRRRPVSLLDGEGGGVIRPLDLGHLHQLWRALHPRHVHCGHSSVSVEAAGHLW